MFEVAIFTQKAKNNLLPLPFQNYFSSTCNIPVHKQLTRSSINYHFFCHSVEIKKLKRSIEY